MSKNLPYVTSPGTLLKMLQKIKDASAPEKFAKNFIETKLGMRGGSARALLPFIKKLGFVSTEGIPTDVYREFRNKNKSEFVLGKSVKALYKSLYEANEYAHGLSENELKGLIVQVTGGQEDSQVTKYTVSTFRSLAGESNFENIEDTAATVQNNINASIQNESLMIKQKQDENIVTNHKEGINLSYTINLNLPASTDIEVFNAIFKSLKEHLLD